MTPLPSEDELLTPPASANEAETPTTTRSKEGKRSRGRQSQARENSVGPAGPLTDAHFVRRSRRALNATINICRPPVNPPRPIISPDATEDDTVKTDSDENGDNMPNPFPSRNRSLSINPSTNRKRKETGARSSRSKRKRMIFGAFDNLDEFIDSENARREVFGHSDEDDEDVPIVQVSNAL